jgi:peptidoglycan/LPS O-acetylase OafA/YrhL
LGAIRLFLALVVATDHLRMTLLQPAGLNDLPQYFELGMNAGLAVMFFYIISGFLISIGLSEKYHPTAAGIIRFYKSRFIRIFSLYWPLLLFMFAAFGFWNWFAALSTGDKFTNLFIFGMDWRILFADYPDWHWQAAAPFFHQAWTLGAELTFYLLAPFILRSWKLALGVLVISAATRGYFVATTVFDGRWTYLFLPSTFLFFLIGHFVQAMSRQWTILKNVRWGALSLGCSLFCLQIGPLVWDSLQFWSAALFFAAALPGIFEATKTSSFMNALGDLSFPIYLVQIMVVAEFVEYQLMAKLPPSATIIAVAFLASVIVAAALAHWVLEIPAAAAMRWLLHDVPNTAVGLDDDPFPGRIAQERGFGRNSRKNRGFR